MLSFSKLVLEWAFTFKVWLFSEMCFHFQNVKGFVSVVFLFCEKHNCKQKFTTNSFTDEVVKKQWNICKAFKFVLVVKHL